MIPTGRKIGIDAGSSLVKLVEVVKAKDGMALANWSFMPFRAPADAPPEAARELQAKAIDGAIRKCECKCRDVIVGVPGNNAFIRNIKLPPVPAGKIDQIVRYEIQQTIPFPIESIALDYQVLEPDESSEVEVIMVAMKGEVAENFIKDIEKANVNVSVVDSIPLALYNCYRYNEYSSKEECTAIVDLGAATSDILIELGGELRYCRSVSIGGNDITEAIAKEFNLPFAQAERLKIQHGLIFPETEESNFSEDQVRLSKAIAGVLDRLLGEVKLTIGYFRSLAGATAISRAVLAGGSAMLKNIRPFLAERLGVQVEMLNPFKKVGVPKNLVNARKVSPIFATAVGLALRSSHDCCQLKISLIPPTLKAAKSRRSKAAYLALSAMLLLGMAGLYLWRMIPEASNRTEQIAALDQEIARYEQFEGELKELKEEKNLLLTEYQLYSKYPQMGVDAIMPVAVLTEAIGDGAWVSYLNIKKKATLVEGAVKSESKLDGLRQLSALRKGLERYCKKVTLTGQSAIDAAEEEEPEGEAKPKKQGDMLTIDFDKILGGKKAKKITKKRGGVAETKQGLTFVLSLQGFPSLPKFKELQKAKAQPAETETEEVATEKKEVAPKKKEA